MQNFQFRLGTVLKLRERQEDAALTAIVSSRHRLATEQAQLEELHREALRNDNLRRELRRGEVDLHSLQDADRYREALKSKPDRRDRVRLYGALADFRDPALLEEAIALSLAPGADFRESSVILTAAAKDPDARPFVWDFLKANFDTVVAKMPREATGVLPYYAAGFCAAAPRRDIAAFFAGRIEKLPGGPRILAQALESIDLCIAARDAQEPGVGAFLDGY